MSGLIEFLDTTRSKDELKIALSVIEEFKGKESEVEWASFSFESWQRLEQLQDYLRLLTGIDVKEVNDNTAISYIANKQE